MTRSDSSFTFEVSKRQKRKSEQKNDKNRLPQMPKIRDEEARARAYIREAGLSQMSGKENSSSVVKVIDPSLDLYSPELKFGRKLAGTSQLERHVSVGKLQAYLKTRCQPDQEGISELDLMKLWKALWHTLYMADKVPVQDELSAQLSQLLWCLAGTEEEDEFAAQMYVRMTNEMGMGEDDDDAIESHPEMRDEEEETEHVPGESDGEDSNSTESENEAMEDAVHDDEGGDVCEDDDEEEEEDPSLVHHSRGAHLAQMFVRTFFSTIRREWGLIDRHRVDKFYTLIRLVIRQVYKYMAVRHWSLGIVRLFNDAIMEEVLAQPHPNGLRYHLIDLSLEELGRVNAEEAPLPLTEATFLEVMEPFFAMSHSIPEKTAQKRVMEQVFDRFLMDYSVVGLETGRDELLFANVHVGTVAEFIFQLASDSETRSEYRKCLYEMHKKYMRRIKETGKDIDINESKTHDDVHTDDGSKEEEVKHQNLPEAEEEEEEVSSLKGTHINSVAESGIVGTPVETSHVETIDHSGEKKSKKKEKKKKKKKSLTADTNEDTLSETKPAIDSTSALKSGKAKRKQKDVASDKDTSKKRRRQMDSTDGNEEEITISTDEQKRAAVAVKETKKKAAKQKLKEKSSKPSKPNANDDSTTATRRVKFDKVNHSKSYKASMSSLKRMETPRTPPPDRGILLKRGSDRANSSSSKQQKRKKALHYF